MIFIKEKDVNPNIPLITPRGTTLAEAWENALIEVYEKGVHISTQYDKPEDEQSKDSTAVITIDRPLDDPMIHRDFPGGMEDLREYVLEVIDGIKDHWVRDPNDPTDTRWEYTYHQRLFGYAPTVFDKIGVHTQEPPINQIETMCQKLADCPYTRRAQAITWDVLQDNECYDPACFCAGSKVMTPDGIKDIEFIKNGDVVYAWDIKSGLVHDIVSHQFSKRAQCVKVSLLDGSETEVSNDQLLQTYGGWVPAEKLTSNDQIFVPSACSASDVTPGMIKGFFLGDGWLSSGYCGGDRKIKRCNVSFGIHPYADDTWIYEFINSRSANKINCKEKFLRSDTVPNGGTSKKIVVTDRELWEDLVSMGLPVGKKNGEVRVNAISYEEKRDILTGIFSAEGCITGKSRPSIQLGMNWVECVDFVSELLDDCGIEHTVFMGKKTKTIHIDKASEVKKALEIFDFRLDSRKQAAYLRLKLSFEMTDKLLSQRLKHIEKVRESHKSGVAQKILRSMKPFNNRFLDSNYVPVARFVWADVLREDKGIYIPIKAVEPIGEREVYDFEVSHDQHAIIVNGIVSHNCLQSIWCRCLEDSDGVLWLNSNVRMRSNDAYKAAFMNMFAFIMLIKSMADRIAEISGREVRVGRYVHMADSFHIYGSYFDEFSGRFLKNLKARTFEERVFNYADWKDYMEGCDAMILEKVKNQS